MSKQNISKADALNVIGQKGKTEERRMAEIALGGIANNASLVTAFSSIGELSLDDCIKVLTEKTKAVYGGDMRDIESMLISQALALDSIFVSLARRAATNMKEGYLDATETYLKLSLKAQSQSRATLEALAEVKNPRPYIQNNRAEYQQVNNNGQGQPVSYAHAGENSKSTNGLLEDHSNEWLDTRAAETSGGIDKELATVGEKHRS